MINGIINIYKEKGYTSHDVVAKMRGILKIKKIGHTGTLDPDAEGVLPVCIGKATKVVDLIVEKNKSYEAILKLGIVTDTQDMTGNILACSKVDVSLDRIKEVAEGFIGGYNQIPPMYSALKVNGRKLYELARQGKEIERVARWVDIHDIQILEFDSEENEAKLHIDCGKGTYIRTLIYDIGELLGCGAAMKSLVRTRVGDFHLQDSLRLKQVEKYVQEDTISDYIIKIDDMFVLYPKVIVDDKYNKLIYNGNSFKEEHLRTDEDYGLSDKGCTDEDYRLSDKGCTGKDYRLSDKGCTGEDYRLSDKGFIDEAHRVSDEGSDALVRVYASSGEFIGIYRYNRIDRRFHVEKMFI